MSGTDASRPNNAEGATFRVLLAVIIASVFLLPAGGGPVLAEQAPGAGTATAFRGGPDLGDVRAPTYLPGLSAPVPQSTDGAEPVGPPGPLAKISEALLEKMSSGARGATTGRPGSYDVIVSLRDGAGVEAFSTEVNNAASVLPNLGMVELSSAGPDEIRDLALLPGVERIDERGIPILHSDVATPAAKARESDEYSPATAWELGYSGEGVSICVMDTGIDNEHPTHVGKFLGGADISKPETFFTPRDGSFDPDDTQGHGTTCAGIAAGTGAPDGTYMGTAPGAHLVDLRIGTIIGYAPGELAQDFYDASLQGLEWALEHRSDSWPNGGSEYGGIDILSLSWGIDVGYSSEGADPYSVGLDTLTDAGVICVVAAGNDGPSNDGFSAMGAASNVITVGATDDDDTIPRDDDFIAEYSSRGPRADNGDSYPYDELKPDVSAPGTHIMQCNFDRTGDGSGQGYGNRGSGTSYATPLVAGVVALMLEANPALDPYVTKEILRVTSERRGEPTMPELDPFWNKDFGWGMVDAYRAVKMATEVPNPAEIDVELQCFMTGLESHGSTASMHGIAWARDGEIAKVQYSIDNGTWRAAQRGPDGTWTNWTAELDAKDIEGGNHTIRARAFSTDGMSYSLHDSSWFVLEDAEPAGFLAGGGKWVWVAVGLFVLAVVALYIKFRKSGRKK